MSLDKLDDRMDRSTRNSIHHPVSSSEDEEEESSVVSPTTQGEFVGFEFDDLSRLIPLTHVSL